MRLKKVIKKVERKIEVLEEHIEFLKLNDADDLVIIYEQELSFLFGIRHDLWKEINHIGK
jgi:hypothetical protein